METISLSDATVALRRFLSSKGLSQETLKAYLTDVKMFWLEMELDLLELEDLEHQAATWLNGRRRIMAPKTTGRRLTSMKNLGLTYSQVILGDYKLPTPAPAKPHPLPGGTEDLKKLLDACFKEEHRVLIALCGLIGMRISEARAIRPIDFNFNEKTVEIWGKGDKVRIVPVSEYAFQVLMRPLVEMLIDDRGHLPMIEMGDRSARDLITTLGVRAKISRPISSHDLRATFATEAYNNTLNIRAVQELLGHASSHQTEIYIEVAMSARRAAAEFMEA